MDSNVMNCPACEKKIPTNSTFCLHCGSRVIGHRSPAQLILEEQVEQISKNTNRIRYYVLQMAERRKRFHEMWDLLWVTKKIPKEAVEASISSFEEMHEEKTRLIQDCATSALQLLGALAISPILPAKTAETLEHTCKEISLLEQEVKSDEIVPVYLDTTRGLKRMAERGYVPYEVEEEFARYAKLFAKRK